jgi:hypothetical protein
MIYETKGLTLEQIDELYSEVKVARQSVGWRPSTTFREIRASVAGQGGQGEKVFRIRDGTVEKVEDVDGGAGMGTGVGTGHHHEHGVGTGVATGTDRRV